MDLSTPAPDGSVHTGVGFYGKDSSAGGSTNVHLSGFAIEGDVRERIDTDQVNGIGGALSNSTITPAGSEFSLTDLGGNTGGGTAGPGLAPWELPNTITGNDRPPVVPPGSVKLTV